MQMGMVRGMGTARGRSRRRERPPYKYKTMLVVDIAPERAHHSVIGAANAFVKAGILNG